jgi:precorrin-2 dehydrogenase/sirohydrochlorin ferrochelatase
MELYPLFLDIENRDVLVIGGGEVAERKVKGLLAAGARVTVVAPELSRELEQLSDARTVTAQKRFYSPGEVKDFFIAVAATSSAETNHRVYLDARKHGVLVNVVDGVKPGSFVVPAAIKRGLLHIAVSTSGKIPYLTRKFKEFFERKLYAGIEEELEDIEEERRKIVEDPTLSSQTKGRLFQEHVNPRVEAILDKIDTL